jgi:hypothetical protein
MFQKQFKRVRSNILPFVYIGLFVGFVLGKASLFRRIGSLNDFFIFARINTYYPDSGQTVFFNHFDTSILTFLLVAIFAFAGLHRIVFGDQESFYQNQGSFSGALESFGSLLAIAWLGLIAGISLPTLIFQGIESCITFLLYAIYPLLFLIEVTICTAFLSSNSLDKLQDLFGRHNRFRLGMRVEGLTILVMGILILSYEHKYTAIIKSFTFWVRSLF